MRIYVFIYYIYINTYLSISFTVLLQFRIKLMEKKDGGDFVFYAFKEKTNKLVSIIYYYLYKYLNFILIIVFLYIYN